MEIEVKCPPLTDAEKAERLMKVDVLLFDPNPRPLALLDESELEPSAEEKAQAEAFFNAEVFQQMTPEEVMADFERGIAMLFGTPYDKLS